MTGRGITGRTRVFGILADPIHHVKTPEVMNALFAERGVDGVLVPFHVTPEGLQALLDGLRRMENFGGFIATVPHKTAMLSLCDEITPQAQRIGAVNCVRREQRGRLVGAMLDGIGFVEGLKQSGIDPRGQSVFLAGAGGAGKAVAFALAEAGAARLFIANRTRGAADALAAAVSAAHPDVWVEVADGAPGEHGMIVNTTSLGMNAGDPLPVNAEALRPGQTVAEVIMDPAETPLLRAARARGCIVHPGRPMLEAQIVLMAEHMGAFG